MPRKIMRIWLLDIVLRKIKNYFYEILMSLFKVFRYLREF
jgi:hypothetical protein